MTESVEVSPAGTVEPPSGEREAPGQPLRDYLAVLACKRCGTVRYVSPLAEPFMFWACHQRHDPPLRECHTLHVRG
jgi:hypothetical protein